MDAKKAALIFGGISGGGGGSGDAGTVTYDPGEEYDTGTVGAALNEHVQDISYLKSITHADVNDEVSLLSETVFDKETNDECAYRKNVPSGSEYASIKSIGGLILINNQIVENWNFESIDGWEFGSGGVGSIDQESVISIDSTNSAVSRCLKKSSSDGLVPGHNYLVHFEIRSDKDSEFSVALSYNDPGKNTLRPLEINDRDWHSYTAEVMYSNTSSPGYRIDSIENFDVGEKIHIHDFEIIDLTLMFKCYPDLAYLIDSEYDARNYGLDFYNPYDVSGHSLHITGVDEIRYTIDYDYNPWIVSIPYELRYYYPLYSAPNNIYDEYDFDRMKHVQRVGTRPYEPGDDDDYSVITDGETTYYPLDTFIETDIQQYFHGFKRVLNLLSSEYTDTNVISFHQYDYSNVPARSVVAFYKESLARLDDLEEEISRAKGAEELKANQSDLDAEIYRSTEVDAQQFLRIAELKRMFEDTKWPLAYLKMGMPLAEILKIYLEVHGAAVMTDVAQLVENFFKIFPEGLDYQSKFTQYDTSPASAGEKIGINANLQCVPSSNTVAGRDDYSNLALFAPLDCNYEIDATTLECKILAIKDVWGTFDPTGTNGMVGVIQMGAWVKREDTATHFIWHYADSQLDNNFVPLEECVKASDNSFRSYMIHAKYAAGLDSNGKMTSGSGILVRNKDVSHNSQISMWRERGAACSGFSVCDAFFRQLMIMIKYGTLSNEAAGLTGCVSYNLEYHPALAENNVERVLVTTAQGANILVGSTMQLSTSSRGGTVTFVNAVLSKETVTIDGTEYCAVNIGNGGTTFNTTTDLFFNSMPWSSGTTDNVLGNDGAAVASSDKYPVKIQGIECMVGAYEVAGDVICTLANNAITYRVCKIAAKIATSATSDYGTVGFTTPQPATAGWQYPKDRGYDEDNVGASILPNSIGGSSSVREQDGYYMEAQGTTGARELRLFGSLHYGGHAGFACGHASDGLTTAYWDIVCRASGTSGNRGEWAA